MTDEEMKELISEYKRRKAFWDINESLENQGHYGFIPYRYKSNYRKYFESVKQELLNFK